jgi:hypothetical protein
MLVMLDVTLEAGNRTRASEIVGAIRIDPVETPQSVLPKPYRVPKRRGVSNLPAIDRFAYTQGRYTGRQKERRLLPRGNTY